MTTDTKHTPTPWNSRKGVNCTIIEGPGNALITALSNYPEAKEDAAFIVRAVNAHDEMLQALLRIDCQFPIGCPGPDEPFLDMGTCFRCAAIAKAEGR
jgi:hypothetical protein